MILELHIELKDLRPTVSRTIHIHRETPFKELHQVIQLLFDWWDTYPYQFSLQDKNEMIILNQLTKHNQNRSFDKVDGLIDKLKLADYFKKVGDKLEYEYGLTTCWQLSISLQKIKDPLSEQEAYPVCIHANNEIDNQINYKPEADHLPFGKQQALQHEDLVNRLNKNLTDNIVQLSIAERDVYMNDCWTQLNQFTKQYYQTKPWKSITNQQMFAIYDARFDEYLFCSVLGKENGLYGLSVYVGFNGLLSLHTSLTKKLSIEQLFHLHANLLLRFEKHSDNHKGQKLAAAIFTNEEVNAQFTSYQPGYYPWKINEKEAAMISLALKHTLHIFDKIQSGFSIPNYIEEDQILLVSEEQNGKQVKEKYVTFEEMIKKVLPLQLTIPEHELTYLTQIRKKHSLTVEFSLQYVDVPIQRLKSNRPFLPLSSVIANQESKQIIYHNIYNARLDYMIVQAEFVQMINLLGVFPGRVLTDELTYHYLKPLLIIEDFPVEVQSKLSVTDDINENVSQYLLTKAE